jgi:1,4-alpha-glucan branching enzyme
MACPGAGGYGKTWQTRNFPDNKLNKIMKHNNNHDNGPSPDLGLVPVRFEFTNASARNVSVAGTFNHWQPATKTLHPSGIGHWYKDTALAPGTYEYCFVVDGQWMPDPNAKQTVPNPFGGRNSVLTVTSRETTHLAAAENLPFQMK